MTKTMFGRAFFEANRANLIRASGDQAPIVLTANGLLQRNGDSTFKFRQDSSFWYLTGLEEADLVLVMERGREYLIVPGRDTVREAFDGRLDVDEMAETSGLSEILDENSGWKRLSESLSRSKKVATFEASPSYVARAGLYPNPARSRLTNKLMEISDKLEIVDLRNTVARLRSIKQPVELDAIQSAIDVTAAAIKYATSKDRVSSYKYEYEIEADILKYFKLHGASGHAFEPIVVAGRRACVLHNLSLDGSLVNEQLLLFDIGAEVQNYAADISRTVSISEPNARQQEVHAAVCDVQDFALEFLKPGVLLKEYEEAVCQFMGEKLIGLGLITENTDEEVRRFYPHATSHFLGLDVHDAGLYDEPLTADMVLTCEPGIYIPDEGIGVRIEDDVLITANGNTNLSGSLQRIL